MKSHAFVFSLALGAIVVQVSAADDATVKCVSPDGRFALQIGGEGEGAERSVALIEKKSGKTLVDLDVAFASHLADTILVWSPDSKCVAYATRGNKQGDTSVYFWDGSSFQESPLPTTLPFPKIDFPKVSDDSGVKNYGGGTKPVRWLKSGDLELSTDVTMLLRGNAKTYVGVIKFTISFDAAHHASVHTVGKTKTRAE